MKVSSFSRRDAPRRRISFEVDVTSPTVNLTPLDIEGYSIAQIKEEREKERTVFGLKEIDDGGDVRIHEVNVVVSHPEEVTSDGGDVVGFTGMGDSVVLGEGDSLLGDGLELGIRRCDGIVGVLEPDLDEPEL